eukprot:TRINITY_DN83065_c0_g1_i1.p1 TRINITY_DN83065_c0_g1~~TRINITY_DN83065_c0_g1_i1.p1  ORF type:complete len:387 (+),score=36.24 TRINITY_DN83065_c0_g1_i1:58-1218(+)
MAALHLALQLICLGYASSISTERSSKDNGRSQCAAKDVDTAAQAEGHVLIQAMSSSGRPSVVQWTGQGQSLLDRSGGSASSQPPQGVPCTLWGCSCQGLSDVYGIENGVSAGSTSTPCNARAWWIEHSCDTTPQTTTTRTTTTTTTAATTTTTTTQMATTTKTTTTTTTPCSGMDESACNSAVSCFWSSYSQSCDKCHDASMSERGAWIQPKTCGLLTDACHYWEEMPNYCALTCGFCELPCMGPQDCHATSPFCNSGVCQGCPESCKKCGGPDNCIFCHPGHQLLDGKCVACTVEHCETCDSSPGHCDVCSTGFMTDGNGGCTPCDVCTDYRPPWLTVNCYAPWVIKNKCNRVKNWQYQNICRKHVTNMDLAILAICAAHRQASP